MIKIVTSCAISRGNLSSIRKTLKLGTISGRTIELVFAVKLGRETKLNPESSTSEETCVPEAAELGVGMEVNRLYRYPIVVNEFRGTNSLKN